MQLHKRDLLVLLLTVMAGASHAGEPVSLFNGKNLDGWSVSPSNPTTQQHWKVEEDVIVGENSNKKASILWTEADYGDFELTLEYRTPSKYYDSGVFLRCEDYQVQIGISSSLKIDLTACIYAPIDGRGGYPAKSEDVVANQRSGEWNKLRIRVVGKRIETFLNEKSIVDYTTLKMPARGPIGLQLHAGHTMKLEFRKLLLEAIDQ